MIYAMINEKGGVGKTTSVVNLGAAFKRMRKKVLIVDMDPSGNLSMAAGMSMEAPGVYELITGAVDVYDTIQRTPDNMDAIRSGPELANINIEMAKAKGRNRKLEKALEPVKDRYDFILIDCPRSADITAFMAVTAADAIVVPTQAEFLSMNGVGKAYNIMNAVNLAERKNIYVFGIFINMFKNTTSQRDYEEMLREKFQNRVFNTKINTYTAITEAVGYGVSVYNYKPKTKGAEQFTELAKEFIKRTKEDHV